MIHRSGGNVHLLDHFIGEGGLDRAVVLEDVRDALDQRHEREHIRPRCLHRNRSMMTARNCVERLEVRRLLVVRGGGGDTLHGNAGDDWFFSRDGVLDHLFGDGGRDTANADENDLLVNIIKTLLSFKLRHQT